jgi:hypothetical protein
LSNTHVFAASSATLGSGRGRSSRSHNSAREIW